jgi:CHRD domain
MRSTLLAPAAVTAALGLAACGGGGSGTSTHHRGATPSSGSRPTQVYRITLSGAPTTPRGAPHGTGAAIIAFHPRSILCWRFAHLHGFTDATVAHIQLGAGGHTGKVVVPLSHGSRLHHQGCTRVSSALAAAIARDPARYYVSIGSAQYPGGAVRAQL